MLSTIDEFETEIIQKESLLPFDDIYMYVGGAIIVSILLIIALQFKY